jgi:DNA invertase Pin-like site-specific DNA recombinase
MLNTLHIYSRVSTLVQEEDGTSIDTQKELGIKKSEELGFEYKIWNEGGQSSNKDDLLNRPVLTRLLESIESGEVKNIFVFNTDRLSRNEQTWSFIRLRLVKYDVTLYTSSGVFNLTNPIDKLLLGIMSEVSSYDNYLRTERSRLGKIKRIQQGFWMGGPPPFGYEIQGKKLIPQTEEKKWLKFIYESYRDKKSIRFIKQELLKNGVKTRRGNSVWSLGSIEKLLSNTHYGGFYSVKDHKSGEVYRVNSPSIIPSTLIRQVEQEKKNRTRQTRVSESNLSQFYLLREFLFCTQCGSRYSGRYYPKQYRSVYYCPRMERNYVNESTGKPVKCENRRYLKIEETDKLVWETVVNVLSKSHIFKEEIRSQVFGSSSSYENHQEELKNLKRKLKKIDTEVKDVTNSIVNLETDRILKRRNSNEIKSIIENIESVRLELESQRENLKQEIYSIENKSTWIDWIEEFGSRINEISEFTSLEKNKFLKGVINKILVTTKDIQTHELELIFKIPYVKDSLVYKDKENKKLGYDLRNGKRNLTLPLNTSKK